MRPVRMAGHQETRGAAMEFIGATADLVKFVRNPSQSAREKSNAHHVRPPEISWIS